MCYNVSSVSGIAEIKETELLALTVIAVVFSFGIPLFLPVSSGISNGCYTNNLLAFINCCYFSFPR